MQMYCKHFPNQAHWENTPMVTSMQNYVTLLLAHFVTLSKRNVQWVGH